MKAERVTSGRYREAGLFFRTAFEGTEFNLLNETKCDELHFLLFHDGELRFGIIGGVRDRVFEAPFSAPYSNFSSIGENPRLNGMYEAVESLKSYCIESSLREVRLTLPPFCYDESYCAEVANALFAGGFTLSKVDLNHHYRIDGKTAEYGKSLDTKAAQKLRSALKNALSFHAGTSGKFIADAYEVIRLNREQKGYPLRLSLQELLDTMRLIGAEVFLVRDGGGRPVASAFCFVTAKRCAQIIYWGNLPGSECLKPMNYLAAEIFSHYLERGFSLVDIGPSSADSMANFGLAEFKRSIGCGATVKLSLSYRFGGR